MKAPAENNWVRLQITQENDNCLLTLASNNKAICQIVSDKVFQVVEVSKNLKNSRLQIVISDKSIIVYKQIFVIPKNELSFEAINNSINIKLKLIDIHFKSVELLNDQPVEILYYVGPYITSWSGSNRLSRWLKALFGHYS